MRRGRGMGLGIRRGRGFTPAALPNRVAWYTAGPTWCFKDAAKTLPCGNGDLVYTWADRSGHGFDLVQATSGSRPTLTLSGGKWGVVHDGAASTMATASATIGIDATTGGSIAVAYNPQATGGTNQTVIAASNSAKFILGLTQRSGPLRYYYRNASCQSSNSYTTGSPNCAIGTCGASDSAATVRLNTTQATPAITLSDATAASQITTGKVGAESFYNGVIYEAVLGSGVWSAANLLLIEAYYRAAWGTP